MNHHAIVRTLRAAVAAGGPERHALDTVRGHLRRLLPRRRSPGRVVILSAEDLFDMHTAHEPAFTAGVVGPGARLLARALDGVASAVDVVCYLRRQDHLLAAHYGQCIKGAGRQHLGFADFRERSAGRLDSATILESWEEAFGVERVTVVPYEPAAMPDGIVGDFFGRVLGIGPPPRMVPFPDDLEAFNVTPARDHLEYMRCLNRRAARGKPVLAFERALAAAFRDRAATPTGIAAWLSPREREDLLARHEAGNRRIALRHGLGADLFTEPLPTADESWRPPRPPDLRRLVALDAQARRTVAGTAWRRAVDALRLTGARQAWWIVDPSAQPADEECARGVFAGLAGSPGVESRMQPAAGQGAVPAGGRRAAVVVLVGPPAGDTLSTPPIAGVLDRNARCVLVLGGVPIDTSRARAIGAIAPALHAVICADCAVRDGLLAAVPALRSVPMHVAGDEPWSCADVIEAINHA